MKTDVIAELRARVAELERPDFRQMREMLRAMQAGELTVSRGIEILDMWHAGNWNDDMLPPVRQDLIEEDSMPVEIIESLRARVAELEVELENEQARGIHSCHPGCLRDGCVNRQLRDELASQALTIKTMRDFVNQFLDENDTTEFGCACDPGVGYTCGQCRTFVRQEPLRKALALPDNSTEALQQWLDSVMGEPVEELDDGFYHCPCCGIVSAIHHSLHYDHDQWCQHEATWINGPLYRKPEIK